MKKTESVTYRTDTKIKNILLGIAGEKKWSVSQLSEEIIRQWLLEHYPDRMKEAEQEEEDS